MNLVVDLGNTAAKAGLFRGEVLVKAYEKLSTADIFSLVRTAKPVRTIVCSVNGDPMALCEQLLSEMNSVLVLTHQLPVPVNNLYQSPQTLGMDRLAAAVGATVLYPRQHCLVIDLGTCVTYDLIDAAENYHGGSISPGLRMRFQAMHTFTARLPLVEAEAQVNLIGKSTKESLQSGVVHGLTAELEGMIRSFTEIYRPLTTLLCGGDARFFETKLKGTIFVTPELVLIGLNRILNYNVSLS